MQRRPYGRDLGLTIRMGIALIPIVLWYLVVTALLVLLVIALAADPSWGNLLSAGLFVFIGPSRLPSSFGTRSPSR